MPGLGQFGHRLYVGELSFDFIGRRRRWYAVSIVLVIISLASLAVFRLNLGIEFRGGAQFQLSSPNASVAAARSAVESAGVASPIVQLAGRSSLQVQTEQLTPIKADAVRQALATRFGVPIDQVSSQYIGPSWGSDISRKALTGLIVFLVLVSVYLAISFEPKMAAAALVALLHDLVITVGVYALSRLEVTPATVIGVLTILGYSLYDTVVVFDKVRENTKGITGGSRMTFSEAANLAVNQSLVRSINTSFIALLPVGSILVVSLGLLGGGTLADLSLALFIGIAVGTYSSVFIATPLLASMREREPEMIALSRRVATRRAGGGTRAASRRTDRGSAGSPEPPLTPDADLAGNPAAIGAAVP
ncbi:MAG: protein translocase subunit SecF, partial [Actinomycetes bacterium]